MEKEKQRGVPVFLLAYLVYAMVYVCRNNIAMVQGEMGFRAGEYSVLVAALLTAYAVGRLLNGTIGDYVPHSVMVGIGITAAGACNVLVGFCYPFGVFPLLCVLWACNGFAQSMIWGPLLDTVYRRCGRRKIVSALFGSSIGAGSVLAVLASGQIALYAGVTWAFAVPGFVAIAAGLLSFVLFREKREAVPETADAVPEKPQKAKFSLRSVLKFRVIGWMLLPAILHGVFKDNINSYAPGYFTSAFGVDLSDLWYFVFVIPVLTLLGRLLHPLLYRLFRANDDAVLLFGFAVCGVCAALLVTGAGGIATAAVCLAVFAAAVSVINATLLTIFPLRFAEQGCVSSVSGTLDFVVYLTGAAASLGYGALETALGTAGLYLPMYVSWLVCCVGGAAFALVSLLRHRSAQ